MKASAFFVAACVSAAPVYAHHGPFEIQSEGPNHGLHLGTVLTPNQGDSTGKNHFAVRACYLDELDFVRSNYDPRNRKTIPFKIQTDKIVAFGLAGEGNTGFNAGNENLNTFGQSLQSGTNKNRLQWQFLMKEECSSPQAKKFDFQSNFVSHLQT